MYVFNKAWSKELKVLKKVYITVVAMATMTFQNGVYFSFKSIDPHFLITQMPFFSIYNYPNEF